MSFQVYDQSLATAIHCSKLQINVPLSNSQEEYVVYSISHQVYRVYDLEII